MDISWTIILQTVIASAVVGALAFFVGPVRQWWSKTKAKWETRPSDAKKFTLLVAELEGDEDKKQTGHVIAELEKQFQPRGEASLGITPYPDVLSIGRGERSAALEAAKKKGQHWLYKMNGDVLIWGEVADKNKVADDPRFQMQDTPWGPVLTFVGDAREIVHYPPRRR